MQTKKYYTIQTPIWEYSGKGAWYFVMVPDDISKGIHTNFSKLSKSWGTVPVEVVLGPSTWNTSLFWSKKGYYYLPVKAAIRKAQTIAGGDIVACTIGIDWMF